MHGQSEQAASGNALYSVVAKRLQTTKNRLSFGIVNSLFRYHYHFSSPGRRISHAFSARGQSNRRVEPVIRLYASWYRLAVPATTSEGNSGPGGCLFHPTLVSQSRTYCLSKLG